MKIGLSLLHLMTVKEASRVYHINPTTLYKAIHAGDLKARLPRGRLRGYLLLEEDIDQWILKLPSTDRLTISKSSSTSLSETTNDL